MLETLFMKKFIQIPNYKGNGDTGTLLTFNNTGANTCRTAW